MPKYALPELGYAHDALEPHVDHPVHGVTAAAADTDNFDTGPRDRGLVDKHFYAAIVHLHVVHGD